MLSHSVHLWHVEPFKSYVIGVSRKHLCATTRVRWIVVAGRSWPRGIGPFDSSFHNPIWGTGVLSRQPVLFGISWGSHRVVACPLSTFHVVPVPATSLVCKCA